MFLIFCCGGVWPGVGGSPGSTGNVAIISGKADQGMARHGKEWQGWRNRKWDLSKEWDLTCCLPNWEKLSKFENLYLALQTKRWYEIEGARALLFLLIYVRAIRREG